MRPTGTHYSLGTVGANLVFAHLRPWVCVRHSDVGAKVVFALRQFRERAEGEDNLRPYMPLHSGASGHAKGGRTQGSPLHKSADLADDPFGGDEEDEQGQK